MFQVIALSVRVRKLQNVCDIERGVWILKEVICIQWILVLIKLQVAARDPQKYPC